MSAAPAAKPGRKQRRGAPGTRSIFNLLVAFLAALTLLGSLAGSGQAAFPAISPDVVGEDTQTSLTVKANQTASPPALGSASLDLEVLGNLNSIGEADNVRWSLAQATSAGQQFYSPEDGVDWKALRGAGLRGSIVLKAKKYWSFNDTFAYLQGYKYASGVYAGGHCALATVLRNAAARAGLPTYYWLHGWPIPGFGYYESVSIWWGRNDLTIYNSTARDLEMAWTLDERHLIVNVLDR